MARKIGEHDFKMPVRAFLLQSNAATFSVGVFAWVAASTATGMRPAKAKVRVAGPRTKAGYKLVHDKAKEVMVALDAGTYAGPKLVRVGA